MKKLRVSKPSDWRSWLEKNHDKEDGVWLVFQKKGSGVPSISYEEAVDEALAFGWIDSLIKKIDDRKYARKFTPRRPWSIWSKSNISRVEKLIGEGRMTSRGLAAFQMRTQEISLLEKINIEGVIIPSDFENALSRNKKAWKNFERFGLSNKKRYLLWISGARTPKTRAKRIAEAVILVSRNVKALMK
ncbi:MAG TPA: YdeI/OmpD-associated family protein [Nitrososphaerales archaeon]|nr:YdeI/OmpD-associated family protein [Nitrososphaerales archaeon]